MPRRRAPARRKGERPTLCTPEVEAVLLGAIEAGVPLTHAAVCAGITPRVLQMWMRHGEALEEDFLDAQADDDPHRAPPTLSRNEEAWLHLFRKVRRARAEVANRFVRIVGAAAQGGTLTEELVRTYTDRDGNEVREVRRRFSAGDWRAAKFMLESSFAREFAQARQLQLTGAEGGPLQIEAGAKRPDLTAVASLAAKIRQNIERQQVEDAATGRALAARVIGSRDPG